jgi:hypothetical protein
MLTDNDRDEANFLQQSIAQCFAVGGILGEKYLYHLEEGEAREGLLEQVQFNYEMISRFVEKLAAMRAVKVAS